jgi:hypothetical protein
MRRRMAWLQMPENAREKIQHEANKHIPDEVSHAPAVGTPTGCTSSSAAALFGGETVEAECFRTEKEEFFWAAAGSTAGVGNGAPSCGQPRCSKAERVKASTSPGIKVLRS